ncbi:MAG: DUF4395 domain-containing protein [Candidatus Kapaibacterium sp.]|jgi:hypothetical protein
MSNKTEPSKLYIDNNVVRLIASQVVIVAALSLTNHWIFPIVLLALDFGIRAFTLLPSLLAFVAKLVSNYLNLTPNPIFATPKKFAAAVGFVFSLAIAVLLLLNFVKAAYVVGGVLIFFAFCEAVFNICVGCYVYNWFVAPRANKIITKNPETKKND